MLTISLLPVGARPKAITTMRTEEETTAGTIFERSKMCLEIVPSTTSQIAWSLLIESQFGTKTADVRKVPC